jgi:ribosomal protein S1
MSSFFDDLRRVRDNVTFEKMSDLRLGSPVTCVVTEVNKFGLETDVDGVRGIIPRASLALLEDEEEEYEVGDTLSAVVVFIDYQFSCVELSPGELSLFIWYFGSLALTTPVFTIIPFSPE